MVTDENASVVDGLGETELEHLRLKATFKEVLNFQAEHVIQLHFVLSQHSNSHLQVRNLYFRKEFEKKDRASFYSHPNFLLLSSTDIWVKIDKVGKIVIFKESRNKLSYARKHKFSKEKSYETTEQGISLEQPLGVLLFESEQLSSGLSHLGERVLYAPHLTLVLQTELADQFQLLKF